MTCLTAGPLAPRAHKPGAVEPEPEAGAITAASSAAGVPSAAGTAASPSTRTPPAHAAGSLLRDAPMDGYLQRVIGMRRRAKHWLWNEPAEMRIRPDEYPQVE